MKPAVNHLLVELYASDFSTAKMFYGLFGFAVAWETPKLLVLTRRQVILCFWPGNDYITRLPPDTVRGHGVELIIMVEDIDEAYAVAMQHATMIDRLRLRPWGIKEFRIADPFGYFLKFAEPYDILDAPGPPAA